MNIEQEVIQSVIAVLLLVGVGRILGMLCSRFGFPEIIGYVVTGIVLGPYAIGGQIALFDEPLIRLEGLLAVFSQIAAIIILFAAGLHFTFDDLKKVGPRAGIVSGIEFLLSVSIAYYVCILFGLDWTVAAIIATTFGATSIAVSTTVLEGLGKTKNKEAKLLVNVAILDDILGLAVLSAVVALILSNSVFDFGSVLFSTAKALGFWLLLVVGAVFFLPKMMVLLKHKGTMATTDVTVIGSAFGFASIAGLLGLNPIVGAFAAGMGLASSHIGKHVREYVGTLKYVAAPLFFAVIGAHVDLNNIWNLSPLLFLALLLAAVSTKIFGSGLPASILLKSKNSGFKVGFGMVARSEVAFITAGVGISSGIIDNGIYSTLTFVILSTIFISPILLRIAYFKK
ncbi:MAG: cation:proton antiporter [Nitrosopumilus sp.]|nr:MAG: cation:proton antiporter [Nitrosopumilus sp.]